MELDVELLKQDLKAMNVEECDIDFSANENIVRCQILRVFAGDRVGAYLESRQSCEHPPAGKCYGAARDEWHGMKAQGAQRNQYEQQRHGRRLQHARCDVVIGKLITPDQRQEDRDIRHVENVKVSLGQGRGPGRHVSQY